MRKQLLCLTAALAIAGCAADRQDAPAPSSKATASVDGLIQEGLASSPRTAAYASMADRGAMLAYQRGQQPVRRAAHTYHSVEISESHALNAAAPGKSISLPLPSGETMQLAYQRHEEGLDGNWTWVGKTDDGLDAVITFGEKAVFGRIAQRDTEALRLTMASGRSWLIETDPSKVLDGNLGRDADASDVLIPPSVATAISAKKRSDAAAKISASDEAAGPADTVDVVLGFTNGLVTKYGGVSQATTRLANLIAITNQGYINSLVTPRVRLVRTVQVSYTDTNSNEVALEAVTGFVCTTTGCTPQTVPAELVPLRNARNEYGGDLVSIVRPFQAPQHQGCGIAWLLGGGGFTIDNTDEPFGYSVISDGSDVDETDGRSYFCREETLAHELGHNMGQQHNIEDSGGDAGTHTYSYGYREATTTGFYTVMAYRLANSSQFSINHFGNPSVTYATTGRPTGSATADNARSLNLSMPLVAQFRNAVVPFDGVPNMINILKVGGSGKTEVHTLSGSSNYADYSLHAATTLASTGSDFTWEFIPGDYNGDGIKDLYTIFRMGASNTTEVHVLNGANNYQTYLLNSTTTLFRTGTTNNWVFRLGDYNGDGKLDLYCIYRTGASGKTEVHILNGANNFSTYLANIATVLGSTGTDGTWGFEVADWNKDNKPDIVVILKAGASGKVETHILSGASSFQSYLLNRATVLPAVSTDYRWDFKLADYNLDGVPDLYAINRQGNSGKVELTVVDGQSSFLTVTTTISTGQYSVPSSNLWEFEFVN